MRTIYPLDSSRAVPFDDCSGRPGLPRRRTAITDAGPHVHRAGVPYVLLGSAALLFLASATWTIAQCASMTSMGEMQMPGGWTMSMVWMRMPGQTWTAAGASFLVMWGTMMVAMMLPSLIPALWRYRKAIAGAGETHVDWRIAIAAAAYFIVWTTFGLIVFPVGAALAALTMQWPAMARAAPVAMGIVILIAGVVQFTGSKARHLACIRTSSSDRLSQRATDSACLYGVRLGLLCGRCCANLMVLLLLGGVMNIGTMALVTMAVTAERLSPSSERAARTIGAIVLAVGMLTVVGAIGVGAGFSRPVGVGAGFSRH